MNTATKYLKILANILYIAIICFVIIYILPKLLGFFMPFVVGWIIALIANPLVRWLEDKVNIMRKYSSMVIILLVLALLITGSYFIVAKLGGQLISFISEVPQIYENIATEVKLMLESMQGIYDRFPLAIQEMLTSTQESMGSAFANLATGIGMPTVAASVNFAKNIPTMLIMIIFTILSAYFFLSDRNAILESGRRYLPQSVQEKWHLIVGNFRSAVGGYLKAQLKIMAIVVLILFIGFLFLQVEFAILLALAISLLDALPFFGTGTALVPWALFNFIRGDYQMTIGLLVIYGISQLVRQIIQPKIVGDAIGVDPLLSLILMYAGYKISGVLGMIVAVPLGMIVINLYRSGAFDDVIHIAKVVGQDLKDFRKM